MSSPDAQHTNRIRHAEGRARKARTPLTQAAIWFDAWRRRVAELPPNVADEAADEMISHLRGEISKLAPRGGHTE